MIAMSWWMWVILWVALVAISGILLSALLWRAWRRFAAAAGQLGRLGASVERVDALLQDHATAHPGDAHRPDVFTPWGEARREYREGTHRRRIARSQRRLARRQHRSQPPGAKSPRAAQ